jgi:type VI secretion system protein ImpM
VNDKTKGRVGFYGKLPIVGDFISRRLPNEFIAPWDSWLQSAMAASREEIGDDWLNSYLTSPIWRFLLSKGVCGDKAVAGIVMPSVDKVGRYYPLTVAVVFEQSPPLPFLFTAGNVWFEQLEDAALTGLEGNLDINAFDKLIQSIPLCLLPANTGFEPPSNFEKKSFYTSMANFGKTADAFIGLNEKLLAHFMPGYSLWSNTGSEYVQPALLACEGLPPISRFSAFLKSNVTGNTEAVMPHDPAGNAEPIATCSTLLPLEPETEQPSLGSILANDNAGLVVPDWRSWALTDTGKRRTHNEDALLNKPGAGLWVVADGMGGHTAGDVASQLIVDRLQSLSTTEPLEIYVQSVKNTLQRVNDELRQLTVEAYDNHLVGSTVVALICQSQQCAFLWVGDSRLYRFRDNQLQQLTQDHCIMADNPVSDGAVKSTNMITRAVGAYDELDLDIEMTDVLDGDIFLLSSDGLDKEMSFKDIERVMQTCKPQDIANALIDETLARGARDNVTVIVVARNENNS